MLARGQELERAQHPRALMPRTDGEAGLGPKQALERPWTRARLLRQLREAQSRMRCRPRSRGGPSRAWIARHGEVRGSDREDGELVEEDVDQMALASLARVERPEANRLQEQLAQQRRDPDHATGGRESGAERCVEIQGAHRHPATHLHAERVAGGNPHRLIGRDDHRPPEAWTVMTPCRA